MPCISLFSQVATTGSGASLEPVGTRRQSQGRQPAKRPIYCSQPKGTEVTSYALLNFAKLVESHSRNDKGEALPKALPKAFPTCPTYGQLRGIFNEALNNNACPRATLICLIELDVS